MVIATIILGTLIATSLMTAFSYLVSEAFKELYKEPVLLQYLITRFKFKLSDEAKSVAGWVIHYTIGLFFVIGFYCFWRMGVIDFSWISALIYGCIIGIIGIVGWLIMFNLTRYKPSIDFKGYFIQLFIAHIIFAIACRIVFVIMLN